jgi:hypothetical protein
LNEPLSGTVGPAGRRAGAAADGRPPGIDVTFRSLQDWACNQGIGAWSCFIGSGPDRTPGGAAHRRQCPDGPGRHHLDADSLLKKYFGRSVRVIRTNEAGERTEEEAKVLAAHNGAILRYADRIETGVIGHLAYPDVPANLRNEPTLVLHLDARAAGEGAFELSYLTRGLSWQADYVANLTADGAAMDLNAGWPCSQPHGPSDPGIGAEECDIARLVRCRAECVSSGGCDGRE